jgi:ATP-dependent RNA helicase SUPV3L1/SUV3
LPPECRKSQATKFNSRDLPYLVATNAIGMGLNLNIRKIVFLSIDRPTNFGHEELEEHEIQQIAGRAGRGK